MNNSKCPVTTKAVDKLVLKLQDILVLLDAKDKDARLDFLYFRNKVVKQYGETMFSDVLTKASGGLYVKDLYIGGVVPNETSTSQDRNTVPKATV